MQKIQQELESVFKLLQIEKEEDFRQYREIIQKLPLKERKEKGYSWYPVEAVKTGYTIGDRAFVVVEKTGDKDTSHMFRPGKTVSLFTQQPEVKNAEKTGIIQYVERNKMKIVLNAKDLPDWLGLGLLGVDLMFDDRTYREMEFAMKRVMKAKGDRLAELRDVILGKEEARFLPMENYVEIPHLNDSQNEAVRKIISAQDVVAVHGPPGTGKTTTLVYAIKQLTQTEKVVLVTAPSNTAVDLLTEKLAEQGLSVVRMGNISRVDESIIMHTLESKLTHHPEAKNIKKVKIQAAEYRRKARKFKRNFGYEERKERQHLHKQAKELGHWANQLEERLIDQVLHGAQVVTATLVGASNRMLERLKFKTIVIDEAAQALEPGTWIPISKASKVVLVGDPFQLPPTVKSRAAQKGGFNVTLLEKAIERLPDVSLLNTQYRMHESIMGFSNQQFYGGKLQAAESVKNHQLPIEQAHSLVFIDTAGCGFEEKFNPQFRGRYNPEEFMLLCEHLYQLRQTVDDRRQTVQDDEALAEEHPEWFNEEGVMKSVEEIMPSIAIISPYREQVIYMKRAIKEDPKLVGLPITVNTIDGFQGQEREIVYISLVRSNSSGEIGFLKDARRMNVAMTRARKLLVMVGDSATIGGHDFYNKLLEYVETNGGYQTGWEYMQ
ncbi:MAG: ATP-dependent RNA/DNA helicase IGHMBP2 [Saprospiraceae bacterium]|jgi:ATP-dependent RNA/DNA helicase IGHMBP2